MNKIKKVVEEAWNKFQEIVEENKVLNAVDKAFDPRQLFSKTKYRCNSCGSQGDSPICSSCGSSDTTPI